MRRPTVLVAVLALSLVTCNQALLTAPQGSTMTVIANPTFITANGGVSVISAILIEPAGTPVPDGTVVQFFTDLGRIDEQGKTNDGVARVNLVADSRSGTAHTQAFSGGVSSSAIDIIIGSALPERVNVSADPPQIISSRTTQVIATVFDSRGNAIANIPVIFSVNGTLESMESGGQPIFTDNNGQAADVMRTRYGFGLPQRNVTVTATTSNGKAGSTSVAINPSGLPAPAPTATPSP